MSTSASRGRIDTAKFRGVAHEMRRNIGAGRELPTIRTQAHIRLIGDQLKEARIGEYTIQCDEAVSRRGGGTAPSPLQYFVAAVGF